MRFLFLLLALLSSPLWAEEPKLNLQPACVGLGMLVAPAGLTGNDLSIGHSWELEGFSYAATDIGERILPKDYWFLSPILVGAADIIYRSGEWGANPDLTKRKLTCDLLGILGRITVDLRF